MKSIEAPVSSKTMEPLVHQQAPEIVQEEPVTMDVRETERLDAVAGSEFVDDRIRLRE